MSRASALRASLGRVPGSAFRRIVFWLHLACGVLAGLIILAMSVTGVLLTYEHQMTEAAGRRNHVAVPADARPLDADALAASARAALGGDARFSLVIESEPGAPVAVSRGRGAPLLLHPYTGAVLEDAAAARRGFFGTVEDWHRWLGGEPRSARGSLVDAANLLFLGLVLTGLYLWLPQVWRWRTVRGLMLFQRSYINAKVRDFNWHHVFSFWMFIPLLLVCASGVVISYDWANRLLFAAYGEQAPQRRGPPGAGPAPAPASPAASAGSRARLEDLRRAAAARVEDWRRLTLPGEVQGERVEIGFELPSSGRLALRRTVSLATDDARVLSVSPPQRSTARQSPAQRARSWVRFVHTGEQYGIVGQTIAGLASLAACFLVYTGLALAWRRLVRPLLRPAG